MSNNLCLHCMEEGKWEDGDKCPACAEAGHVSPWVDRKCPACNLNFEAAMRRLKKQSGRTLVAEKVAS